MTNILAPVVKNPGANRGSSSLTTLWCQSETALRSAEDLWSDVIVTLTDVGCDIEFSRIFRILAVADPLAIDQDKTGGTSAGQLQKKFSQQGVAKHPALIALCRCVSQGGCPRIAPVARIARN